MAEPIFFTSAAHKGRFIEVVQRLGKTWPEAGGTFDPEYAAALYILTSDAGMWNKAHDYVSSTGIDIEALLQEVHTSGGEGVLIQLAGNLFNNQQHLDPLEFLRLDESNFRVALTAILLRRYGYRDAA